MNIEQQWSYYYCRRCHSGICRSLRDLFWFASFRTLRFTLQTGCCTPCTKAEGIIAGLVVAAKSIGVAESVGASGRVDACTWLVRSISVVHAWRPRPSDSMDEGNVEYSTPELKEDGTWRLSPGLMSCEAIIWNLSKSKQMGFWEVATQASSSQTTLTDLHVHQTP